MGSLLFKNKNVDKMLNAFISNGKIKCGKEGNVNRGSNV
jgi:hypothetical protein